MRLQPYLFYAFLLSFFSMIFLVSPALSHGNSQSFPKDVGIYTVELEYDASGIFDDTTAPFVFRLLDQKTKDPVKFDSLLVRFERKSDKSTTLVTKVAQDDFLEGVGRITAMLNRGDYLVALTFYNSDNKIAQVEYDLSVVQGESTKKFPFLPVGTFLVGSALGFAVSKVKMASDEK